MKTLHRAELVDVLLQQTLVLILGFVDGIDPRRPLLEMDIIAFPHTISVVRVVAGRPCRVSLVRGSSRPPIKLHWRTRPRAINNAGVWSRIRSTGLRVATSRRGEKGQLTSMPGLTLDASRADYDPLTVGLSRRWRTTKP